MFDPEKGSFRQQLKFKLLNWGVFYLLFVFGRFVPSTSAYGLHVATIFSCSTIMYILLKFLSKRLLRKSNTAGSARPDRHTAALRETGHVVKVKGAKERRPCTILSRGMSWPSPSFGKSPENLYTHISL